MKCTPAVSHNVADVCLRSCSRTPFVAGCAGVNVPSRFTRAGVAGRLAGRPTASKAGRIILLCRPLRSSGADQSSTGLRTWLPCSLRGYKTALGLSAAGCVSARYAAILAASQAGKGTVRLLVLDFGVPVTDLQLQPDLWARYDRCRAGSVGVAGLLVPRHKRPLPRRLRCRMSYVCANLVFVERELVSGWGEVRIHISIADGTERRW